MSERRWWRQSKGQGLLEYMLLLGLIVVAVVAALIVLGPIVSNLITGVAGTLPAS